MNILVVDEARVRREKLVKTVESKKHTAVACSGSNEFISAVQEGSVDRVLLDVNTWREGRSIYNYLGLARKLEKTPVVFYNAPEGFTTLGDREANEHDRVLPESLDIDTLVNSIQQEL